ncbi:putative polysaccharide biosynthesis protein [Alkalicoccus halolimnae]|uniref:Polysaccharide biosynthesis protein n=1 Tax=Alkalicoccus halolimnae TaxID=1667239 RepID=A0A5C7F7S3_9BACI|nr:polysaccharide biosynthesis protein [Alkalicoccus halolimnae]TXF85620.1 polysaccharide biosynthesis protein [Alkalicoccus halolimnae]
MSQSFMKGALIITLASLISKLLGSLFRIPLQNIAGDEVFGIFSIVYPVYMAVLILSVAGIPLAVSKLISEARINGGENHIRDIHRTGSILACSFGISAFLVILLIAAPFASLLGGEFAEISLIVVSASLLIAPYMAVYRGYFQGFQEMGPTAFSQVLEQFVRVFFILLFAYILVQQGYSASVVAGGVMTGSIFGALASFIYLRRKFVTSPLRPEADRKYSFRDFKKWTKTILYLSLPICVGALAMALVNFIDSVTVPGQLGAGGAEDLDIAAQYGYYGRGLTLVQIVVVFAQALILPLIPLLSASLKEKDDEKTSLITEQALKFMHVAAWPAAIGLFVLTVPLNFVLFGDTQANEVLAVVHLSAAATSFAVLTTGILQGMNKQILSAGIVLGASLVKIVLNIILIRYFGLIGVAWSTFIVYILLSVWNLWVMKRTISFRLFGNREGRAVAAAVLMGVSLYIPLLWTAPETWGRSMALMFTVLLIAGGGILYGVFLLLLKAVSKEELKNIPVIGPKISRLYR